MRQKIKEVIDIATREKESKRYGDFSTMGGARNIDSSPRQGALVKEDSKSDNKSGEAKLFTMTSVPLVDTNDPESDEIGKEWFLNL